MFTEGEEMYLQGEQNFHTLARSLFFFFAVSFILMCFLNKKNDDSIDFEMSTV